MNGMLNGFSHLKEHDTRDYREQMLEHPIVFVCVQLDCTHSPPCSHTCVCEVALYDKWDQ